MDKNNASEISKLLAGFGQDAGTRYRLKETHALDTDPVSGKMSLSQFHQWADGRPCVGAYLFVDQSGTAMWLLILDWAEKNNYYLILYPESKDGSIAEIHRLTDNADGALLHWNYSPKIRDGRNEERKAYFSDVFLSTQVQISVPRQAGEVDDFLDELFSLASSRTRADALDPSRPLARRGFPEGRLKQKLHLARERNPELVRQAKALALARDGRLKCACCGFDFFATYGTLARISSRPTTPSRSAPCMRMAR